MDVVKQLTTLGRLDDWDPTDANSHYDQHPDSEDGRNDTGDILGDG